MLKHLPDTSSIAQYVMPGADAVVDMGPNAAATFGMQEDEGEASHVPEAASEDVVMATPFFPVWTPPSTEEILEEKVWEEILAADLKNLEEPAPYGSFWSPFLWNKQENPAPAIAA